MGLGIKIPKNVFAAGREKLAEGDDFQNVELPPGRYTCILKKGRAVDTKNGAQIVFDLEVAGESDQAGGKIGIFFSLGEERIVWLFRVLTVLGYDVSELDESVLEEILNDIASTTPVVRVSAKHTGEYTNYRIDKLMPELTAAEVKKGGGEAHESAADPDAAPKAGLKPKAAPAPPKDADPPKAAPKAPVKKAPIEPEPEPEEVTVDDDTVEEEGEVELKVGMEVKANIKGVKQTAKVLEIGEDNKVLILAADKKKYRIDVEKLEL